MSSFEDIETQNARRPRAIDDCADWHWLTLTSAQYLIALGRAVGADYNGHVKMVTAPLCGRSPRTALGFGLLPPVAP